MSASALGLGLGLPFRSAGGFSPLSLFAGGANGAWYDPSDSTTLFSDRAGTTPCGTPGGGSVVPVGLMLDKSQGLVLGSETVTNGDFSGGTTTGWTPQSAALSVVGGQLSVVPSTTFGYAYQTLTTVVGTTYKITFDYNQSTAAIARYFVGTAVGGDQLIALTTASGVGSISRYFTATTTTTFIHFGAQNSSGLQALFDNISVRALAGNHAIAANDTTARPELRARVNLITNSENFAGTGWSGTATIATDVTTAPNGTTTADSITAAATSANQYIRRSPAGLLVNVQFAWSVAAKKNTSDWLYLRFWDTSNAGIGNAVWFNVANGTVGSSTAGTVGSITNLGDGWYRCTVTRTIGGSIAFNEIDIAVSNADNTINATAGNSVFVWGAQLTATNEFPANTYQRIVDANTYDAVGFPRYLVANGTSSAMSTPGNIPFATVTSDGQARRNLLSNPTQFDVTTSWGTSLASVVANTTAAPDGTTTADTLSWTTSGSNLLQSVTITSGASYTFSIYMRVASGSRTVDIGNINGGVWSTVTVTTEWQRFTVTQTASAALRYPGLQSGIGGGGGDVFIWGAQLETGSTATAFQNIGTDKVTVFAGVRKLSDAAIGTVVELGNGPATNTFAVFAPRVAPSYTFRSAGSINIDADSATTFSAPTSNVLSGAGNIAAPSAVLRVNGVQVASNTSSQGTGNYSNNPLFIGARNNASLFFNGHLYSLLVVGSAVSAGQISATEQWVAGKTGITI